jgi:lathosterol oxidase
MGSDAARLWLLCALLSCLISVVTYFGLGGLLHWWFYVHRRDRAREWKHQPDRWLDPALQAHAIRLGGLNLLGGSLLGATFIWHVRRGGWTTLYFDVDRFGSFAPLYLLASAIAALLTIDAGLYYTHRLLHDRRLFRYIHRWHHRYVAPTIFTTTAMHPIEFLVFVACLAAPAFVIPMHAAVYGLVIAYTYFVGMLDHSGVRARLPLPLHGDNAFHDEHHIFYHCNYGHHTTLFDRLHGTVRRPDRVYDEHTFGAPRR